MKKFFFALIVGIISILIIAMALARHYHHRQVQVTTKAPQTKVTIVEGWTNQDIISNLNTDPKRTDAPHLATPEEFLAAEKKVSASDYSFLASKPVSVDLQGFLFPDTYFLPEPSTSTNESELLIKKALNNFDAKVTAQMRTDAQKGDMTLFQIVTLASIIEKESASEEDRPIIAGIFYNRLNIGMPLQSDASQITYTQKGLPPQPICNPSLSSIMAAIYPAKTNYLYFLTDLTTGKAVFAKTLDQQVSNEKKYLK